MSRTKRAFKMVALAAALAFAVGIAGVSAQEDKPAAPPAEAKAPVELPHVNFDLLDGKTKLIAHLFRPPGDEPRPAVVTMHG